MKNKKNGPKKGFKNLDFSLPRAFLAEAVQTQKSPSGQLPEDRRPEGLGNEKLSSMISIFGPLFGPKSTLKKSI